MTIYFYDDKDCVLIAVDLSTKSTRILHQAVFGAADPIPLVVELPPAAAIPGSKAPKAKLGKKGCSVCHKPGHNAKTCIENKENQDALPKDKPGRREAMSRDQFEKVKLSVAHDIGADVIARELRLTIREVNRAILAKTFDDYLAS